MSAPLHYPVPEDVSLLPVLRALITCYLKVERVASQSFDAKGLTTAQFDVLATLGDTAGMTCKELGQRALITGGTLTPVVDRMLARGLVMRSKSPQDNRQTIVALTAEGQAAYEQAFLPHVALMRGYTDRLSPEDQAQLIELLGKLAAAFSSPPQP